MIFWIGLPLVAGCGIDVQDLNAMLGKSSAEVVHNLGEPDRRAVYNTAIIDPTTHSAGEVKNWLEMTPQHEFIYGDWCIRFNQLDVAFEVVKNKN